MSHPYHHAISSSKKWGGTPEDYQAIHDWFDASKAHVGDARHRALRHHTMGIFWAEEVFGTTITISTGRTIPTRWVGEQHVLEDMGFIPDVSWWFDHMTYHKSMNPATNVERKLHLVPAESQIID